MRSNHRNYAGFMISFRYDYDRAQSKEEEKKIEGKNCLNDRGSTTHTCVPEVVQDPKTYVSLCHLYTSFHFHR